MYNFNSRVSAPCPYLKEMVEREKASPYIPNPVNGESGPPLAHVYGKYGSRAYYDPRERGGILHLKFVHAFIYDTFTAQYPTLSGGAPYTATIVLAVQYAQPVESRICTLNGFHLSIRNYRHLTGEFHLLLTAEDAAFESATLQSGRYYRVSFGKRVDLSSFLSVDNMVAAPTAIPPRPDIPNGLVLGGANDLKIDEFCICR